eukprot:scaffold33381_cov52-Phaeocystis_antarctica.AAC.4
MRLVTFSPSAPAAARVGVLDGSDVVDLTAACAAMWQSSRPEASAKSRSRTPRWHQIKRRAASSLGQPRPASVQLAQVSSGRPATPPLYSATPSLCSAQVRGGRHPPRARHAPAARGGRGGAELRACVRGRRQVARRLEHREAASYL